MRFGVLGPLVIYDDAGQLIRLSGPARRLLLAALVSRAGQSVTAATLMADLWGDTAPASAPKTLQSHIARLRGDLGRQDCDHVLTTDAVGYRLAVPATAIDAGLFEEELADGRELLRADRPAEALDRLAGAIARWRGDAYVEFAEAGFAVAERQRLSELRSLAREERTEAALSLGQAAELVADLEAATRLEPYRERGWEQLMVALYRAGRQGDALAVYVRARQQLVEDLGVEPGPALQDLERQILAQDKELLGGKVEARRLDASIEQPKIENPYRGLAAYGEADAHVFVARQGLLAQIAARLVEGELLVVTGSSGVGKSSLVRAGLVPALRGGALPGSSGWRISVVTPDGVLPLSTRIGSTGSDLLVVDQAEEIFTLSDRATRAVLEGQLEAALVTGARVVLVLRADFYGRMAELSALGRRVGSATVLVGPPTETELREVVLESARRVGLGVEPELVERILIDLRQQPGALPLLSAALLRTFENRDGRTLTTAGYLRAGGVEGALEATAEAVYLNLDEEGRQAARRLLVRLTARAGAGWVRRPMSRQDTEVADSSPADHALTELVRRRLVVVSRDRIEIAHEALLSGWPRLRGWLEERSIAADIVEHLDASSRVWDHAGRGETDLYRGARLQAGLHWQTGHPEDVSRLESAFLEASAAAADAELVAAQRKAAAEARGRRRLRYVASGLAAATAIAVVVGLAAANERSQAKSTALTADAGRVAALSLTAPDLQTSLLLGTAGFRLQDSAATQSGLLSAVERTGAALYRIPTANRILALEVSADGRRLLAMDNTRTVFVYDVATRSVIGSYAGRSDHSMALSPDGKQLVVVGTITNNDPTGPGRVAVLDASNGTLQRVLPLHTFQDSVMGSFTADGRWFATMEAADGGHDPETLGAMLDVYDAHNWASAPRRVHLPATVTGMAGGRDAFVVTAADGTLEVIRAADLALIAHAVRPDLRESDATAGSPALVPLALSDNGLRVAIVPPATQNTAILLDTDRLQAVGVSESEQTGGVYKVAFSPDSTRMVAITGDGHVVLYAASTGLFQVNLVGHSGPLNDVAWAGSGAKTALYTAGLDSQIISWDLSSGARLMRVSGPDLPVPDGARRFGDHVIGVAPADERQSPGEVLLDLDLTTGTERNWRLPLEPGDQVSGEAATPDGRTGIVTVWTANGTGEFQVWDLASGRKTADLALPAGDSYADPPPAAISADGRTAFVPISGHGVNLVALPSGRIVRTLTLRFADDPTGRVEAEPLEVDPHGRLLVAGYDPGPSPIAALGSGSSAAPPLAEWLPPPQPVALFDQATGRRLGQLSAGDQGLLTFAWSPDHRQLAIGTVTGTVTLADARTLRPEAGNSDVSVAAGPVFSVDYSPDGRMLVTGATDSHFGLWDVATMRRIGNPVPGTADDAVWAWFDPTGAVVGWTPVARTQGGPAAYMRWFQFPGTPQGWASAACALAGRTLTRAEWSRYVGDRPYRNVCPAA